MKSIFITGATSGIGLTLAKKYLDLGFRVGVCGRSLDKYNSYFSDATNVTFYQLDVTNREEVKNAINSFSQNGLDILITSAGISFPDKTKIPNFERSYQVINTNLLGTMYAFEAAIEIFVKQNRGHLVAISSIAGLRGFPGVSAYSASKSAVIKLCESYSVDLKNSGIHVTCVCPGFVDTPLTRLNKHPMPFLVSSEFAAQKIISGIDKKKIRIYFPFIFSMAIRILSILPYRLYHFIISKKSFNFSKKS